MLTELHMLSLCVAFVSYTAMSPMKLAVSQYPVVLILRFWACRLLCLYFFNKAQLLLRLCVSEEIIVANPRIVPGIKHFSTNREKTYWFTFHWNQICLLKEKKFLYAICTLFAQHAFQQLSPSIYTRVLFILKKLLTFILVCKIAIVSLPRNVSSCGSGVALTCASHGNL